MKKNLSFLLALVLIGATSLYFFTGLLIQKEKPIFFSITSHGGTATTWLSSVLNSVPQISCSHYIYDQEQNRIFEDREKASVKKFFAWQQKWAKPGSSVIGNVHGYTLAALLPKLKKTSDPNLKIMNIVRHPILQLESMYNQWKDNVNGLHRARQYLQGFSGAPILPSGDIPFDYAIPYAEKIKTYLNIDITKNPDMFLFLSALAMQDAAYQDMKTAIELQIPQIKTEEMTKDKATMDNMIRYISNNTIILDAPALEKLINTPAKNKHKKTKLSEKARFNAWEDWKKFAFYLHLLNCGGVTNNAYIDMGYDLSFIDAKNWQHKIKS